MDFKSTRFTGFLIIVISGIVMLCLGKISGGEFIILVPAVYATYAAARSYSDGKSENNPQ